MQACGDLAVPLVLFVRDAESTLCGSFERMDAFVDAFNPRKGPVLSGGSQLILLAGCGLPETGSHLTAKPR